MSVVDSVIDHLPPSLHAMALRHKEFIKFGIVGGTTFVIDFSIYYTLKLTALAEKPITAKIIAGIIAVIASYILNREWTFQDRGGREAHHEAFLFFAVSGVGVVLSFVPLWISRYVLHLDHLDNPNVSFMMENIADFVSAFIIGNILQMLFRFWAMRRYVFPDEMNPIETPVTEARD